MRGELYIYIGVMMVMLSACGSYRKSTKEDLEGSRRALTLSEMSGVGEMHGDARMSEGVSVVETEVHFSLPDSTGEQHITKTVTRRVEAKREADAEVVAEDSVTMRVAEVSSEDVEVKTEVEKEVELPTMERLFGAIGLVAVAWIIWMIKS